MFLLERAQLKKNSTVVSQCQAESLASPTSTTSHKHIWHTYTTHTHMAHTHMAHTYGTHTQHTHMAHTHTHMAHALAHHPHTQTWHTHTHTNITHTHTHTHTAHTHIYTHTHIHTQHTHPTKPQAHSCTHTHTHTHTHAHTHTHFAYPNSNVGELFKCFDEAGHLLGVHSICVHPLSTGLQHLQYTDSTQHIDTVHSNSQLSCSIQTAHSTLTQYTVTVNCPAVYRQHTAC